jgi:Ca2+/Na+ antiporter
MRKIGTFFYLLGIFWIGFFALSMHASSLNMRYLLYGMLCFVVGFLLKRLSPSRKEVETERFRAVSKLVDRRKLSRQEKEKGSGSHSPDNRPRW